MFADKGLKKKWFRELVILSLHHVGTFFQNEYFYCYFIKSTGGQGYYLTIFVM